jgi:hypothetical protein
MIPQFINNHSSSKALKNYACTDKMEIIFSKIIAPKSTKPVHFTVSTCINLSEFVPVESKSRQ